MSEKGIELALFWWGVSLIPGICKETEHGIYNGAWSFLVMIDFRKADGIIACISTMQWFSCTFKHSFFTYIVKDEHFLLDTVWWKTYLHQCSIAEVPSPDGENWIVTAWHRVLTKDSIFQRLCSWKVLIPKSDLRIYDIKSSTKFCDAHDDVMFQDLRGC